MTVVDLTSKRLDRLEKSMRALTARTDARFGRLEGALGQIVGILEAHTLQFERMEAVLIGVSDRIDRLTDRVDRLTSALIRGRTQDLVRFEDHERRLRTLERRRNPRRGKRR
jgi:hypothetical protein